MSDFMLACHTSTPGMMLQDISVKIDLCYLGCTFRMLVDRSVIKWASFCFIALYKWGDIFAVLIGLQCIHVMRYGNCAHGYSDTYMCFSRWCGGSFFMITMQEREGHLSYLNAELMSLLSGHSTRNPKQKKQAESCRVKAIRWFSFTGGY